MIKIFLKSIMIVIIILQSSLFASAQFQKITRLGFNYSSISKVPSLELPYSNFTAQYQTGLSIGQGVKYNITPKWAAQVEAMYLLKDVRAEMRYKLMNWDSTFSDFNYVFSSRVHYMQFPILMQYRCNITKKFTLIGQAGFYAAAKIRENTSSPNIFILTALGEYFQKADVGGVFSIGAEFVIGEKASILVPELRITQTFSNGNPNYIKQKPTLEISLAYVSGMGK